ncbi:hypothetical protein JCM21714_2128 [Gracilibacillus boraciitolerans JCM 21714]|uniref:Uncharacterized protein n=1 Tax=Gracilibacillus boraciitolerans JCM 21714 TaxID=1298598 RepID=W4VIW7_9BACI|nr:hypothetical protein [Gracilibacillus boraciitolerans]GAE93091.1 hypothetical protein JCM21714_2128 [Gracilibacillus boraciitolerans JCM 21714]
MLNEIKKLNIKPITAFNGKGIYFIVTYPTIFKGVSSVLCALQKDMTIKVIHNCHLCRAYGYHECPYIRQAINEYKIYRQIDSTKYVLLQQYVDPKYILKAEQIPVPSQRFMEKGERTKHELIT